MFVMLLAIALFAVVAIAEAFVDLVRFINRLHNRED